MPKRAARSSSATACVDEAVDAGDDARRGSRPDRRRAALSGARKVPMSVPSVSSAAFGPAMRARSTNTAAFWSGRASLLQRHVGGAQRPRAGDQRLAGCADQRRHLEDAELAGGRRHVGDRQRRVGARRGGRDRRSAGCGRRARSSPARASGLISASRSIGRSAKIGERDAGCCGPRRPDRSR